MSTLIKTTFKSYFYIISTLISMALFLIAINQSSQLQTQLASIFTNKNTLTKEEIELQKLSKDWNRNANDLFLYTESDQYLKDNKAVRVNMFNEFSDRNNALMLQTLNSKLSLSSPTVHNILAQQSIVYANYFDDVKKFISTGSSIKATPNDNLTNQLFKDSNHTSLSAGSILVIVSLALFLCSLLHVVYLLKNIRKENYVLNSQVDTFKNVISNMSEGVIVTDKYGFFTFRNESAKKIIGPVVNDIFYSSSIDVLGFHTVDGNKLSKENLPMYTALKKNVVSDQEFLIKNQENPDGIYISASNGYYVDSRGLTSGSVVVLKNISAKKQLETFWKNEKERALENSKLKSDFLASMSHEIRTPMNAVLGLTTLLKETKLNIEQKDYVTTIQRSAKSLLTLINDILDHSKIEAGKLELTFAPFSLRDLATDIVDNFKPLVLEKNISINLDLNQLSSDYYISDANRIRQIIFNLLGNAIKFTQVGFVELKILTEKKITKIIVKDTGSGMSQVEVNHLFQRYFQTKNGQTAGGTGLGLSICKQLVDLFNGEIGVNSEPNSGTEFWFTLPLEPTQIVSDHQSPSTHDRDSLLFTNQYHGLILVAEDSTVNQKVIMNYLTKLGFKTVIANNGQEAIMLYQTHLPDLIFMDSNMPVMNGLEATRKIIELQNKSNLKKTPIIGLSADARQKNLDDNLNAGMSGFLTKPIELDKLVTTLNQYFTATKKQQSQIDKIKDLMVGEQLLLEVLLQDFTEQTPAKISTLSDQLEHKCYSEVYQIAHNLKSACAELDALELKEIFENIESLTEDPSSDKDKKLEAQIIKANKTYLTSIIKIEDRINMIKQDQKKAS